MGIIWQWCLDHLAGPGGLVAVGAMLSAVGGLWLLVQQNKFERDMRRNAEENLLRTKDNLEQTQEAIRQITGGDSYCYYSPIRGPATSTQRLVLFVVGQYHLFDVIAAIVDLEKQKNLQSKGGIPLAGC